MVESLLIATVATALLVVSGSYFATAAIVSGRVASEARWRRKLDMRSLRHSAEIARLSSDLQVASPGTALPWRVMEVDQVVQESEDCCSFYLIDPYGQPLPAFRPGQHLLVRPALAGVYQTTRCYSLSSAPDERFYRITVKRQASAPRDPQRAQGGLSAWLHDSIGPRDCLLIGGPSGQFCLPEDHVQPLMLLAAGVGITPMASMLRWSLENTPERPVKLMYQAKDRAHWPLGASLHRWQKQSTACHVRTYFSRENPNCENRAEFEQLAPTQNESFCSGKFTASDVLKFAAGVETDYFICGPVPWMAAMRAGLLAGGISEARIHWESFGSAPPKQDCEVLRAEEGLAVAFEHSSVQAVWNDPTQSLWELARESNVAIPSGCLSGVCGCCRVKLLEGQVSYDRHIAVELAAGECLTCVARPTTACRLDV